MSWTKINVKEMASNEQDLPMSSDPVKDSAMVDLSMDDDGNIDDTNVNDADQDDEIIKKNLCLDLPSLANTARTLHAANSVKKTIKRRLSKRQLSKAQSVNLDSSNDADANINPLAELGHQDVIELMEIEDGENEMVKSMSAPMAERRSIRKMNVDRRKSGAAAVRKNLSCWKLFKFNVAMGWKIFREQAAETFASLKLWRTPLKEVEGNFGNGVLSYFIFLKSLFWLNVAIFLVMLFIVVPQALINYDILTDYVTGTSIKINASAPMKLPDYTTNYSVPILLLDFFTGQGFINTTIMFYSNYHGKIVIGKEKLVYNMPFAYVMVGGTFMIVSLLIMVRNFSERFTASILESNDSFNSYCNKVFASWDFCITSDKAADLKKNIIYNDFVSDLAEEERILSIKRRTRWESFQIYTIRFACNLLVLGLLAASIYAIIYTVKISTNFKAKDKEHPATAFFQRWAASLTITALNMVLPSLFQFLTPIEKHSPRVGIAMALWRSVVLKLASVGVLIITLYARFGTGSSFCDQCWENQVAAQMFNLILVDFFVVSAVTIFVETGRKYVHKYVDCGYKIGEKIGRPEFDIPKNVLDLVYGQSLIWIGTFFAPLIPILGIIKLFILFYVKKVSLMYNCKASSTYQGSRSNYFITLLLLLTFLLCSLAIGYGVARLPASKCGPYSNIHCDRDKHIIGIVATTIEKWPKVIASIIAFVKTAVFLFPMFIIIFLLLYYYHSMTMAHEKMIDLLHEQLKIEGRDKRFLMNRLVEVSKRKLK